MEMFSYFLLFTLCSYFCANHYQSWKVKFLFAKTLGFKNILKGIYTTLTMLCLVLVKSCIMKLNKKFNIRSDVTIEPLTPEEIHSINKSCNVAMTSTKYYKVTYIENKQQISFVILVDNDIGVYPIMATSNGVDITDKVVPFFSRYVEIVKIDENFVHKKGETLIVNYNEGSERVLK
jgi:hypothetical protein